MFRIALLLIVMPVVVVSCRSTPTLTLTPVLPPVTRTPTIPGVTTVERYGVLELTYTYSTVGMTNPWETATGSYVDAVFNSPSGKRLTVDGFYYDLNTYKVRFTPTEIGVYSYSVTLSGGTEGIKTYAGSFDAVASSKKGFIRKTAGNPARLMFEGDGEIYAGAGLNDSWGTRYNLDASGNWLWWLDRQMQPIDTVLQVNTAAGYNIFRFNPSNGNDLKIYVTFGNTNTYQLAESKHLDRLFQAFRLYDWHIIFTFFVFSPPQGSTLESMQRAIRYTIARWGAYVDIWEIANEQSFDGNGFFTNAQISQLANFVRTIDPYKRLVMNSNEQNGDWQYLDVRSPHVSPFLDMYSLGIQLALDKDGNPNGAAIIAGEVNKGLTGDPLVVPKVRQMVWDGFMAGMLLITWECCYMPNGYHVDVSGLQRIVANVDTAVRPGRIQVTPNNSQVTVRTLNSNRSLLFYVKYLAGNTTPQRTQLTFNSPIAGVATWFRPSDSTVLGTVSLIVGAQTITTPDYLEDIVLMLVLSSVPSAVTSIP